MESLDSGSVDFVIREPPDQLFECDPRLEPGERRTQAEVDAMAEGQVAVDGAIGDIPVRDRGTRVDPGWPPR